MKKQYNPDQYNRRSLRLKHYDYNQSGLYFITTCVQNRECLFGEISSSEPTIILNEYGLIVQEWWQKIPEHFPDTVLDLFVVMPNHFHGLIQVQYNNDRATHKAIALQSQEFFNKKTYLGKIMAYFKYQSTKIINQRRDTPGQKLWQRNYYEHIVRNERSLEILRNYICNNPNSWNHDQLHPNNPSKW